MILDYKSIKKEAFIYQLNYEHLCNQIEKIAIENNFNYVHLSDLSLNYDNKTHSYTDNAYIWLSDKENNYYNNNKGFTIKIKKDINFLNLIEANRKALAEDHKLCNYKDYYIKHLKDNKPTTLLNYINDNDFLCFAGWNGFSWRVFTMDEYKKTLPFEVVWCIGYTYNQQQANDARKNATKLIAIYRNKEKQDAINNKINERKKYKLDRYIIDPLHRYNITDVDKYKCLNMSVSYTYTTKIIDYVNINGYYTYFKNSIYGECDYKTISYNNTFDKSGYCFRYYQEKLKKRLNEIKQAKEKQRKEASKQAFINSDKSDIVNNINSVIEKQKATLLNFLKINVVFLPYAVKVIKQLKENINKLNDLKNNINNYASYSDPYNEIENAIITVKDNTVITLTQFNNSDLDWCNVDCYKIKDNNVVARYDWMKRYPDTLSVLINTDITRLNNL